MNLNRLHVLDQSFNLAIHLILGQRRSTGSGPIHERISPDGHFARPVTLGDWTGKEWIVLSGLAPGKGSVTSYRLPTDERGAWALGPISATLADPLGLTSRAFCAATISGFVVHPRTRPLAPLPPFSVGSSSGPMRSRRPAPHGEELRSVREYQPGDDLRRVHWPATARWDRLTSSP